MSTADQPLHQFIATTIHKDINNSADNGAIKNIIRVLDEFDVASAPKLKALIETASIRDACQYGLSGGIEYAPFAANDLAQVGLNKLMTSFSKVHGATSPGTIVLAIISNVAIPSIGSTAMARGVENLGPKYSLPDTPKYQHPGWKNKDFAPIVTMPLLTFVVSNVLYLAISTLADLPKGTAYVKPAVGVAAAMKQIYEAWKVLQDKREKVATDVDGEPLFRQPWLEKGEAEIREHLQNLLSLRTALEGCFHEIIQGTVVRAPGNVAAAMISPKTASTVISLAPAAVLSNMGLNATDPAKVLAWNILAGTIAIGLPGTGIGMTNQAAWQWALEKATFKYWDPENADKFGNFIQKYAEALAGQVKDGVVCAPGAIFDLFISLWETVAGDSETVTSQFA